LPPPPILDAYNLETNIGGMVFNLIIVFLQARLSMSPLKGDELPLHAAYNQGFINIRRKGCTIVG